MVPFPQGTEQMSTHPVRVPQALFRVTDATSAPARVVTPRLVASNRVAAQILSPALPLESHACGTVTERPAAAIRRSYTGANALPVRQPRRYVPSVLAYPHSSPDMYEQEKDNETNSFGLEDEYAYDEDPRALERQAQISAIKGVSWATTYQIESKCQQ